MHLHNMILAAAAVSSVASVPINVVRDASTNAAYNAHERVDSSLSKRVSPDGPPIMLLDKLTAPNSVIEEATEAAESSVAHLPENIKLKAIDEALGEQTLTKTTHEDGASTSKGTDMSSHEPYASASAQLTGIITRPHKTMVKKAHMRPGDATEQRLLKANPTEMTTQELKDAYRFLKFKHGVILHRNQQGPRSEALMKKIDAITKELMARDEA